jgi:hypothetical protein
MIISDANDDWVAKAMDSIEKKTNKLGVPGPSGTGDYNSLSIPDFVPKHVHEDMTEVEILAVHDLVLKKDWLTPDPRPYSRNRHFPKNEDISTYAKIGHEGAWSHAKRPVSGCFL